ncbi:MAG TPA: ParB/RepB/Spo0J family partition protein [Nevskiaceae bacterium]|nr:ParB/RepB/Spo0J family partition protein [Nevskiaceae bacterium]
MVMKKRGLGRGLDALLSNVGSVQAPVEPGEDLRELAVGLLSPGKHQPRRHFDEAALAELAASIAAQGVVQPIVVRPQGEGRYEIVAGERRWRAAQQAGLSTVPAVIRSLDERGAMAVALVENIQRADLNALEEAEALKKLIDECGLTHEQAATAVGRSRVSVTNLLRVMELHPEVQQWLRENRLSLGHAKVLLAVQGERQAQLARKVVEQQLTVRATEALVKAAEKGPRAADAPPPPSEIESRLTQRLGLPVSLVQNARGRGKLTVSFRNASELERVLLALR